MANRHAKNRYALTVGHIAIEWNYLERDLQCLALRYLKMDAQTAAQMFAHMGNVSRAEFVGFLAKRLEDDPDMRAHVLHFVLVFHRLRANRNIVEHGVPALTRDGDFLGEIVKLDRRSGDMPFAASQATLDDFLGHLREAREYISAIRQAAEGEASPSEIEKLAMPAKLAPTAQRVDTTE